MVLRAALGTFLMFCYAAEDSIDDVIIIGAGQAGMAAAHLLASRGHSVRVIEATDHVGGRTRNFDVKSHSFDVHSDDAFEVGGTWLSPKHTAAISLSKELGIEVYNASFVDVTLPDPSEPDSASGESWPWWYWGPSYPEDQMTLVNATIFHGPEGKFFFRTPEELVSHLSNASYNELKDAEAVINEGTSVIAKGCWKTATVGALWAHVDANSTGGALGSVLKGRDAQQILRNCIHTHNAEEPEQVGFLYNLFSFKGCNSGGPDNQFRVRGGTQALPLAIAARLGDRVMLNAPVQSVSSSAAGVRVSAKGGLVFDAKAAVITGPPSAILGIEFEPAFAGAHAQLLQRMPMGTSLKFAAVYRQGPWWRDLGLQGDILSTVLPKNLSIPGTDIPLFVQCMDHSPFSRDFGIIACFVEGRQNLYFMALSHQEQDSLMRSFLRRSFDHIGLKYLPEPDSFVRHNWADQEYARGAYTGYFPSGVLSVPEFWKAYQQMEKIPNVFLAGSDYHTGWGNGYIEGAIRSGQRAAEMIHARISCSENQNTIGGFAYV